MAREGRDDSPGTRSWPGPGDDRDRAEELMATWLAEPLERRSAALEELCRAHPEEADELRARIELLRRTGIDVDEESVPEQLGDFRLLRRLGQGGMGVVYAARQESLGRDVALKLVRPELLYFPGARERFQREVEAVAKLQHPGIVPVYAVGEERDVPYFAMELVGGCTLAEVLEDLAERDPAELSGEDFARAVGARAGAGASTASAADSPFVGDTWVRTCFRLVGQVADALQHAHERGVLHRDVKPSNVLVTPDGRALLMDFGLAYSSEQPTLTQTGTRVGSMPYMAPERFAKESAEVDSRCDVYSLGVTLYELLTLALPFPSDSTEALIKSILECRPAPPTQRNPGIPWDAATVCMTSMECDPGRRYATAADFGRDVRAVLELRPIEARRPGLPLRAKRWVQRYPTRSVAMALGFVALVVAPGVSWIRIRSERDRVVAAQQTSSAVNGFLQFMLGNADPVNAGPATTLREMLDRAGAHLEERLADEPEARATIEQTIASTYASLGLADKAHEHAAWALAFYEGRDDLTRPRAETHTLLGQIADARAEYAEAERHLRAALALWDALEAEEDLGCSLSWSALGLLLSKTDELDEAEACLRRALAINIALEGESSARAASTMDELGSVLWKRGDRGEAEDLARRALAVRREVLRADHPRLADSLNNVAFFAEGEERIDLLTRAVEVFRASVGEEHRHYVAALGNLGWSLEESGRRAEARDALERAAELGRRTAAERELGTVLAKLSDVQRRSGDLEGAGTTLEEVLAIRRSIHGERNSAVADTLGRVAYLALQSDDLDRAEQRSQEALDILDEIVAPEDPRRASALFVLGLALARAGDPHGGEPHLREAHTVRERALGPDHWMTANAGCALAEALAAQERFDEAEELLLAGHAILLGEFGELDERTRAAVDRLVSLYGAWGRPDRANAYGTGTQGRAIEAASQRE